eukprot:TRINITY_DN1294_c0_g1_i3.p1 TRINITY_DN1294_c0_g1~~TRINITY_DN1294_c0_g1_i3.p1  ORF type:complete len:133 (-),score=6.79 TRINITY_DN1294_c0_g1_i3:400-768(-)
MADEKAPAPADQKEGTANTISVSLLRSPVFYANLTKRFLHGGEVEVKLTGLGEATASVVGACEILKRQEGLIKVNKIESSLSERGQARLVIVVTKGAKFDELDKDPVVKEEASADAANEASA